VPSAPSHAHPIPPLAHRHGAPRTTRSTAEPMTSPGIGRILPQFAIKFCVFALIGPGPYHRSQSSSRRRRSLSDGGCSAQASGRFDCGTGLAGSTPARNPTGGATLKLSVTGARWLLSAAAGAHGVSRAHQKTAGDSSILEACARVSKDAATNLFVRGRCESTHPVLAWLELRWMMQGSSFGFGFDSRH
jgi:hypothetical protein